MLEKLLQGLQKKAVIWSAAATLSMYSMASASPLELKWNPYLPEPNGYVVMTKMANQGWVSHPVPHGPGLSPAREMTLEGLIPNMGYRVKVQAHTRFGVKDATPIMFYAHMDGRCDDRIYPNLSVSKLPKATNKDTIKISGYSSDNSGIAYTTINGSTIHDEKTPAGNGSWSKKFDLERNAMNAIYVKVQDGCGNSVEKRFNVKHDDIGPKIDLAHTPSGIRVGISETADITLSMGGYEKRMEGVRNEEFKIPYRHIVEGDNRVDVEARDESGNRATATVNLFAKKGYKILEDCEGSIDWTNQEYISIDDKIVREGDRAMRFDATDLAPEEERVFELNLSSPYVMREFVEQRVSLYSDSSSPLEVRIGFYEENLINEHLFVPESNWMDYVMTNAGIIEGMQDAKRIVLSVKNKGRTISEGAVLLDRLIGYDPIHIVDFDGYISIEDAQENWMPSGIAEPVDLADDRKKQLLFPADLSRGGRGDWRKYMGNADLSNVAEFRFIGEGMNLESGMEGGIELYDNEGHQVSAMYRIKPGMNDIVIRKSDFKGDGEFRWKDASEVVYSVVGDGIPMADMMVSTIGINDDMNHQLKDYFDTEPPIVTDFRVLNQDGKKVINMKYEDLHPAHASFYDGNGFVGEAKSSNGLIRFEMPNALLDCDIRVELKDSRGNMAEYVDSLCSHGDRIIGNDSLDNELKLKK